MADPRSVLEEAIRRWNAHDRAGWVDLFDENAQLQAPSSVRSVGRAGAEHFYDTWTDGFPDRMIELTTLVGDDRYAVEEGRFTGTHTGTLRTPGGDIAPTGRTVTFAYAAVCRLEDDRIVSFRRYFDAAEVLVQLGVLPAP